MTDAIRTVGELREFLANFHDGTPILCQALGAKSGVLDMLLHVVDGAKCGFKWDLNPVILQLRHPFIETLTAGFSEEATSP